MRQVEVVKALQDVPFFGVGLGGQLFEGEGLVNGRNRLTMFPYFVV